MALRITCGSSDVMTSFSDSSSSVNSLVEYVIMLILLLIYIGLGAGLLGLVACLRR